jgi:uridine kinase
MLMGIFSSDYQNKLFIPFVLDFLSEGGNPYQRFYVSGITNAFPYPPVMLLVESIGGVLVRINYGGGVFWRNFLFKIPIFLMDIAEYKLLIAMCPSKKRYVAVLYYASPIILYGAYMHSQLDLIPMVFLTAALYFLVSKKKNRYVYGVVFMVLALLCKLHILAVIPIIIFYIERRDGLKRAVMYLIEVLSGSVICMLPFMSEGFINCVLFNAEQSVLTEISFNFSSVEMYIPIVAVLIVYLISFKMNFMNRELFLNLCGIVFAIFLALCPPMPGWYIWIVPFMTLFFVNIGTEKYKNIGLYAILNGFYLIYFIILHDKGYVDLYLLNVDLSFIKIHNATLQNLFFTLLSGTLIYMVISMYQLGIASNTLYKRRNVPFTIGIAGDSGAGKSTMTGVIEKALGRTNLLYIEGDGDHRWERGDKNWDEYTALNPKANYLYRQAEDLKELREGSAVYRVDYDHSTGKFTSRQRIKSKKYVMLCGLHAIYLPQMRKNLDLKIYMDSDETLRRYWKIQRDTSSRGHSKEKVIESIEERMPDAKKYIYPQKEYADLIVHYYDKNLTDCMVDNYDVHMSVRLTLSASINIELLVNELKKNGINVEYDYSEDLQYQIINLDADNLEKVILPVEKIAENVIPQLEEITREEFSTDINGKDGIIILFMLLLISNKMQEVT